MNRIVFMKEKKLLFGYNYVRDVSSSCRNLETKFSNASLHTQYQRGEEEKKKLNELPFPTDVNQRSLV